MNKKQFFFLIITLFLGVFLHHAMAASKAVSGYAWSENIGWIHFNPPLGGVFLDDSTGILSGYAWSENIGWVDFGPTGGYPSAPNYGAKMDLATGFITGWAKAVAGGSAESGGWDGWIRMRGAAPDYGVSANLATGDFSGWAWASDVVGWIAFSGDTSGAGGGDYKVTAGPIVVPVPTLSFSAAPNPVPYNTSATISWSATDASSCTASGDWSGAKAVSGSQSTGNLTSAKTYILTCTGAGGSVSKSVTVSVQAAPFFSLNSSNVLYITLVGTGSVTSNNTTINVSPQGGFNENVSLSSNVSSVISGATDSFSDTTLSSGEYASGSTVNVTVPSGTAKGLYTVTITGTSPSFTSTVNVNLNIESLNPKWKEI